MTLPNTIKIEHLAYTIHVKDIEKAHNPHDYEMFVRKLDKYSCEIYTTSKKITMEEIPTLAHEVLHALQYISESRNIDMILEQEHMGYLMQFIMSELLGFKYAIE